jgi:peptidoglycan hydrolase-like protein with peptidoglycan-binding domain
MRIWASALALTVAGVMLTATAFAQGSSGTTSKDTSTGTDSSATTGTTTKSKKSDAMKSDSMKSDTSAKSDTMKSDSMKSDMGKHQGRMARNPEKVKAAQQALKDKGIDPGPVDGKMGPKTSAALREYQQKEGLKASGRLDSETMGKLGMEAKSSGAASTTTPSASPSTGSTSTDTSASGGTKSPETGAGASGSKDSATPSASGSTEGEKKPAEGEKK